MQRAFRKSSAAKASANVVSRALFDGVWTDVRLVERIGGLHGVLAYLNARTRFRFTAIGSVGFAPAFRQVYDREIPGVTVRHDRRFEEMMMAGAANGVRSEMWASIVAPDGTVRGVLWHYDLRLRLAPAREDHILQLLGQRVIDLPGIALTNAFSGADHPLRTR